MTIEKTPLDPLSEFELSVDIPQVESSCDKYRTAKEILCLGMTAARLCQAYSLYKRVKAQESTYGTVAGIIAVDLADGMIARRMGVDTPKRRMADAVVDRITTGAGFLAAAQEHPETRPIVGALAAREIVVGAGNAINLARNQETLKGGGAAHRLAGLSIAAFGLSLNMNSRRVTKYSGAAAVGINLLLATDYVKAWKNDDFGEVNDEGVRVIPGFSIARRSGRHTQSARSL